MDAGRPRALIGVVALGVALSGQVPETRGADAAGVPGGGWSLEVEAGAQTLHLGGFESMTRRFLDAKSAGWRDYAALFGAASSTEWSVDDPAAAFAIEVTARLAAWGPGGPAFRLGWLEGATGRARWRGVTSSGQRLEYDLTMEPRMSAIMLGGWWGGAAGPLRFTLTGLLGFMKARAAIGETQTGIPAVCFASTGGDFEPSDTGVGLDAEGEAGLALSKRVTLVAALGWRQIKADRFMTYSDDASTHFGGHATLAESRVWFLSLGNRISDWNFSGLRGTLGLRVGC